MPHSKKGGQQIMGIKEKFTERDDYSSSTERFKTLIPLDNWSQKGFFYGRINENNRVVAPVDTETMAHLNEDEICFNFVVDAYNDFRDHYREKVLSGMRPIYGQKTFDPQRAFIKPLSIYYEHTSRLQSIFIERYLIPDRNEIINFDDFMKRFDKFVKEVGPNYPILFSSYVGSSLCPMHSTALMIELWDAGHDNDNLRSQIVDEEYFYMFSELAKEYGFVIPRNAPWCIFANLDSTIMQQYAIQYDVEDKKQIMDEYYYECKDHDIDLMKAMLFSAYERFEGFYPTIERTTICPNGRLNTTEISRSSLDSRELSAMYSADYWLRKYVEILLGEKKINISKNNLDMLMKDCYYMFNKYGFGAAYTFIEMKVIKTKQDQIR